MSSVYPVLESHQTKKFETKYMAFALNILSEVNFFSPLHITHQFKPFNNDDVKGKEYDSGLGVREGWRGG